MKLKYLVTGTGRCGTVFMARLLTSVGIPCGHETIFDWRGLEIAKSRLSGKESLKLSYCSTVEWNDGIWSQLPVWLPDINKIEAESSYMAAPFLDQDVLADATVIHVVRNPIRVVNSFCNHIEYFRNNTANNSYEQFIYNCLPELRKEMPACDRACLFYIRWNQMIKSSIFHRIEDDPQKITEALGINGPVIRDKTINTMKKKGVKTFFLQDIQSSEIRDEFVALGKSYGYHMQSEYLLI